MIEGGGIVQARGLPPLKESLVPQLPGKLRMRPGFESHKVAAGLRGSRQDQDCEQGGQANGT